MAIFNTHLMPFHILLHFPVTSVPHLPLHSCSTVLVVKMSLQQCHQDKFLHLLYSLWLTGTDRRVCLGRAHPVPASLLRLSLSLSLSGSGQTPSGHGCWWVVSIAATKPHPAPQQRLIALQWSGSRSDLMGFLERQGKMVDIHSSYLFQSKLIRLFKLMVVSSSSIFGKKWIKTHRLY